MSLAHGQHHPVLHLPHGNGGGRRPHRHAAQPELGNDLLRGKGLVPANIHGEDGARPHPKQHQAQHQPRQQGIPLPKPPEKKRQPPPPCHLCLKPRPLGQSLQLPGLMGGGLDHQGKPGPAEPSATMPGSSGHRGSKSPPAGPLSPERSPGPAAIPAIASPTSPPYSSSSLSTQPVIRISPARMALISRSRPRIRRTHGPPFTWISSFP